MAQYAAIVSSSIVASVITTTLSVINPKSVMKIPLAKNIQNDMANEIVWLSKWEVRSAIDDYKHRGYKIVYKQYVGNHLYKVKFSK